MTKLWQHSMLLFSLYFLNAFHQVLSATNYVSSKQQVRCHDDESLALMKFKQSFSINKSASVEPYAYAKVASWKQNGSGRRNTTDDCCSWDGVVCSEDTGHVIGLHLSSSFLYGPINSSSSLFLLVHLQSLDLSDNDFMLSQIPSGIASLSQLTSLNLSASLFGGQIPKEISQLTQLASLDLSGNSLQLQSLSFEHLVQSLKMLKELSLSSVNISSQVPRSLANLTSLRFLALRECGLTGEFPSGIFHLPELQFLRVSFNKKLTGSLPEFHAVSRLEHLRLAGTSFSGRLPDSIGNLKSLVTLDLTSCFFSESLPSSLGNLTKLTTLYLGYNRFNGYIPSLASLSELRNFSLANNEFNAGNLPNWLGKLVKLTVVELSYTNLYGVMPSSLSNLTQLTYLYLDSNNIYGQIPSWIMNLTQLTRVDISNNSLQGPIPTTISQLEHINRVYLHQNNLSGIVEANVFLNLKKLHDLQLTGNMITFMDTKNYTNATLPQFKILGLASCNLKVFPNFLQNQNELQVLFLSSNYIHGQIPEWFWNYSKETLEEVDLSDNLLTGFEKNPRSLPWVGVRILYLSNNMLQGSLTVPPPNTMIYHVQQNRLTGEIPPLICQVSSLHSLVLSENNMTGIIPPCLGNQINSLSILMLNGNIFRGTIPNSFVKGSKLELIDISENQFGGQLPRSLANCSMLQFVNIADNNMDDNFPVWLGILSYLQILILRSNKLHGEIKSSLTINSDQFPKLRILDLSDNCFTGDLPEDYMIRSWAAMKMKISDSNTSYLQKITTVTLSQRFTEYFIYSMSITNRGVKREYVKVWNVFTVLDLSSNRLVGEISATIGQLQGLQLLNLSNNYLSGCIPVSFANLTNLESLDLSRNRLSGEIPRQLAQLTFLAFLNVSSNHLVGPIPQGKQMSTFENNSYEGNLGLCGEPLSKKCGNSQVPLIVPRNEENDDSLLPTSAVDWIIIILGLASGLVVGLIFGQYLTNRHHDWFVRKFGYKMKSIVFLYIGFVLCLEFCFLCYVFLFSRL